MCMFPAAVPRIWVGVFRFAIMSWDKMIVREAWCAVSGAECVEVGLCGEAPMPLSPLPARTTSVPIDKIRDMPVLCSVP